MNKRSAPRFPLETAALLWLKDKDRPRIIRVRAKDISRTGLYFYADFQVSPVFKFAVRLPASIAGKDGGVMRGEGRFVRYDRLDNRRIGFAATIERFEIERPKIIFNSAQPTPAEDPRNDRSPRESVARPDPRPGGVELEDYIGSSIRLSGPMFPEPVIVQLLAVERDRIFVSDDSGKPPFWVLLSDIKIG
jgi:hypothetical protein